MWNADVEISLCRPSESMDYFFRNGEGDEVIFVHEGSGTLETIFGELPYRDGDYVVVPRGTTYRFRPEGPQRHLVFETPGLIEIPRRYRNQYGQIVEGAPYYHRDIHPPTELHTIRERGEFPVKVRVRGGYQTYVVDYHPFDVVGWDGYLFPWTFSIHDFEPITGRIHQPPPSHQTFAGRNFVICSFCPRKLDFDPLAVPIPYHHSNLQSEEMIYYVSGNFGSRRGVEVGSITLHPSGLPHGPQPGLAEAALGIHETSELAVMCDTFNPLKLSPLRARARRRRLLALLVRERAGPEPTRRPTRPAPGSRRTSRCRPASARSRPAASRGATGTRSSALDGLGDVFAQPTLNPLLALGPPGWGEAIAAARAHDGPRTSVGEARMRLPFEVADYVDFYSSLEHATNLGRILRPDQEPLLPNWRWLPVGYHGRAGTVVVSGTDVVRPRGQASGGRRAVFGPTEQARRRARARLRRRRAAARERRGRRVRRARLRRRARERLERARHPGVGVRAARAVPRQVVPDVDLGVGDAARAARAATGRGAAAGAAAASPPRRRPRLGPRPRARARAQRRGRLARERAHALLDDAAAARARDLERRVGPHRRPHGHRRDLRVGAPARRDRCSSSGRASASSPTATRSSSAPAAATSSSARFAAASWRKRRPGRMTAELRPPRPAASSRIPTSVIGPIREEHPLVHSDLYGGFWVLTRYDDVTRAALDHESFTSAVVGTTIIPPSQPRTYPLLPIELDPPEHTLYRGLVNALFSKPRIDGAAPGARGARDQAARADRAQRRRRRHGRVREPDVARRARALHEPPRGGRGAAGSTGSSGCSRTRSSTRTTSARPSATPRPTSTR